MRVVKKDNSFTTVYLTGDDIFFLVKKGAIVKITENIAIIHESANEKEKE